MSAQPSPEDRLYRIVREGNCIGCGICQSIAGKDVVKVARVENGYERPVVVGNLDHSTVDAIYATCPGTRVEGLPEGEVTTDTKVDNVWGPWRRMVRAYASDPLVRHEGATGGVLTALAIYLLESKSVEFILHAKASTTEPTFGEQQLSFTTNDVWAAAGSRYGPTAILRNIDQVLDRGQPFAFIGKPCDIAALRNYGTRDERVGKLVRYWLTPVCGGFMPPNGMDAFLDRQKLEREDITGFRYRGRGCPGPTRVETANETRELHYLDLWGDDESGWVLPWRCKTCPDGIGDAADIAASDTWIGGSPNRVDSETDLGTNGVIARTETGVALLDAAVSAGALTIEYDITPDDMSVYQPHQMHKKYQIWARYQGLEDAGYMVPRTERLRLAELANELTESANTFQREGTRDRVIAGRAAEDIPRLA